MTDTKTSPKLERLEREYEMAETQFYQTEKRLAGMAIPNTKILEPLRERLRLLRQAIRAERERIAREK